MTAGMPTQIIPWAATLSLLEFCMVIWLFIWKPTSPLHLLVTAAMWTLGFPALTTTGTVGPIWRMALMTRAVLLLAMRVEPMCMMLTLVLQRPPMNLLA